MDKKLIYLLYVLILPLILSGIYSGYQLHQINETLNPKPEVVTDTTSSDSALAKLVYKQRWEYKVVEIKLNYIEPLFSYPYLKVPPFQSTIDQYAKQGWELIAIVPIMDSELPNLGNPDYHTGVKTYAYTRLVRFIFKRPFIDNIKGAKG